MRAFFTITAAVEATTGIALVVAPSAAGRVLTGDPLDTPVGLLIARVLGVALCSLGTACWLARDDARSRAAGGLMAAMLLYNIAVAALLGYARIGSGLSGIGLWPAVVLHSALAVWCVACLRIARGCESATPNSRYIRTETNETNERFDDVG